jgi:Na+/melibiose symporter-like transporter
MTSAPTKLPFSEKAGYALGDAACNFYWKTFEFFLLFYYTDVFGLIAAASVLFYKLDDRTMQQVGTDLAARRAAATT